MTRPQAKKLPPATGPRYCTAFTNGVWTIFDRQWFDHGRALNTRKQADSIAADLNAGKVPR